jgi:hypothetical protein
MPSNCCGNNFLRAADLAPVGKLAVFNGLSDANKYILKIVGYAVTKT